MKSLSVYQMTVSASCMYAARFLGRPVTGSAPDLIRTRREDDSMLSWD